MAGTTVKLSGDDVKFAKGPESSGNAVASSEEQRRFIETISEVLCAAEDKENVIEWVNNQIGTNSSIIIGGTEYRLSVGPYENILIDVGMETWENWSIANAGT